MWASYADSALGLDPGPPRPCHHWFWFWIEVPACRFSPWRVSKRNERQQASGIRHARHDSPSPTAFWSLLMTAVMIGIPHKGSHTAVTISVAEQPLGTVRVRPSAGQADKLVASAASWPERTWAVEGGRPGRDARPAARGRRRAGARRAAQARRPGAAAAGRRRSIFEALVRMAAASRSAALAGRISWSAATAQDAA